MDDQRLSVLISGKVFKAIEKLSRGQEKDEMDYKIGRLYKKLKVKEVRRNL